jgi:hypothetical protein
VTAPAHVSVQHQKLLHFVGEGKWSDERVLAKVRELVMSDWPTTKDCSALVPILSIGCSRFYIGISSAISRSRNCSPSR